jgi:hypothetical protein
MTLTGRCHCGRNAFEVDGELPEKLTRCTCSFCSKRGHLYAYYPPDRFKVTQADGDAIYRWNSRTVHNHFCSACGCDLYADSPISSVTVVGTARHGGSRSTRGCSTISRRPTGR